MQYEHLLKLLEDGGLEGYDDTRFVAYLQGFERFRNRLSLADHQSVRDAQRRDLAGELCHSTLPRALAATLRISIGRGGPAGSGGGGAERADVDDRSAAGAGPAASGGGAA